MESDHESQTPLDGLKAIEKPLFLVGTIKSGSTLLAQCLGEHPLIHYAGFELSAEWSQLGGAPMAVAGNQDAYCPRLVASDVTDAVRTKIHTEFARLQAQSGREVFLNKNPHLSNKLPYLRELFPDASLIVTARDLRSTVQSIKVHWERMHREFGLERFLPPERDACWTCSPPLPAGRSDPERTFPGGDIRVLAEYWLWTYETLEADLAGFERVVPIRYRDFMAAPHEVLAKTLQALDIAWQEVEFAETIDQNRSSQWRDVLTPEDNEKLADWISLHRDRIERLQTADTALPS